MQRHQQNAHAEIASRHGLSYFSRVSARIMLHWRAKLLCTADAKELLTVPMLVCRCPPHMRVKTISIHGTRVEMDEAPARTSLQSDGSKLISVGTWRTTCFESSLQSCREKIEFIFVVEVDGLRGPNSDERHLLKTKLICKFYRCVRLCVGLSMYVCSPRVRSSVMRVRLSVPVPVPVPVPVCVCECTCVCNHISCPPPSSPPSHTQHTHTHTHTQHIHTHTRARARARACSLEDATYHNKGFSLGAIKMRCLMGGVSRISSITFAGEYVYTMYIYASMCV